jgi:hypothetical protein
VFRCCAESFRDARRVRIEVGLEHGGFMPKGRKAGDGFIDGKYQLIELPSVSYPVWTKRNVRKSDGTVVFRLGTALFGGSDLTFSYATRANRPIILIHNGKLQRIST